MIDLPLDRLLPIAEADRQKNEAAFQATAKQIDPAKTADAVLASLQAGSSRAADKLLETTQGTLDSLRQFIVDHHIVTIPPSDPAHVKETPPFMRSTTSASMDTPGPFEKAKLKGFYNMTLPDPRWPKPRSRPTSCASGTTPRSRTSRCTRSIRATTCSSSTRSSSRRTCARCSARDTNAEGWAHYCEQMMLDEGFHAAIRSTAWRSCRTRCCATSASSSASRCTRRA